MRQPGGIPRLDFLDALRAIAALWVVHYHLILIPQPNLARPEWAWLAPLGGMGVTLFFVASSFSLCYTMPVHEREGAGLRAFYMRRFFRIAPLFYVMLALYFVRDIWLVNLVHGPGEIAINALFIFNLIPGEQSGYVWASWTIGIEMLFYLVFPFAYLYFNSFAKSLGLVLLCALIAWASYAVMGYFSFDREAYYATSIFRHLPIFATGVVAFHAGKLLARLPYRWPLGVAFLAGGMLLFWALIPNSLFPMDSLWWQGISFALILIGLLLAPVNIVVNRVTGFLGKTSYSLYLLHPTLVLLLVPAYRWVYVQPIGLSLQFVCCSALTLALLIPLSYLSYRWIERPGINLGRNLLVARTRVHHEVA